MIKVKHLMDEVEGDDGVRIWVEPMGLVREYCQWCKVDHVLPNLGPPPMLAEWFAEHPADYDQFRAKYHEYLQKSGFRDALTQLAKIARHQNVTLLHHGENPGENTGTALHEFIDELNIYIPPD